MGLGHRFDRIEAFVRGLGVPGLTFDRASGNNAYVRRYGQNLFHFKAQERWTFSYIFKPTSEEVTTLSRSLSQPASLRGPDKTGNYRFHVVTPSDMDVVRSLICARAAGRAPRPGASAPRPRYVASQWSPEMGRATLATAREAVPAVRTTADDDNPKPAATIVAESSRELLLSIGEVSHC